MATRTLSRRCFLVSSGTVLLASVSASRAMPSVTAPLRMCVVTAEDSTECCAFQAQLPSVETTLQIDAGDYLARLTEVFDARAPHFIVGLTRHSDFIVLSQFAYERGFMLTYRGRHVCSADGLVHTLNADASTLRLLSRTLATNADAWASALAHGLPVIAASSAATRETLVTTHLSRSVSRASHFASWAFRRYG